ncbi:lymphocyte function-associated antigen 3 [Camelus ferus]|uniref:Lymphocyte function-associated antigen 3 n=2 Tax=Camelus TaxID=9836 RepID=A0A8B8TKS3_CAMFR|nr:lymphocyte function-associated antigen 3 [Camelus ferus]XP_032342853.1 lymphocyte function-associated antigen 3 [Camelus ferus]
MFRMPRKSAGGAGGPRIDLVVKTQAIFKGEPQRAERAAGLVRRHWAGTAFAGRRKDAGGDAVGGRGARRAGPLPRAEATLGCARVSEAGRTAMAAGSAPGWAARALGAICLLLNLDFTGCSSQPIFGALNGNVTLRASPSKPTMDIVWKKGKDKVVELDDQFGVKAFPPFEGRVHLDNVSGSLSIFNLKVSDEDEYEIESPSIKNNSKYTLKVIEFPPLPTVNCMLNDGNITLQCMILEPPSRHTDLLQYSWECPPTMPCPSGSSFYPSDMYVLKDSDLSQEVQCVVSNPLFKQKSSITLSTCAPSDNTRHRYALFAILPAVVVAALFFKCFLVRRGQHMNTQN